MDEHTLSAWRDQGHQPFRSETELQAIASTLGTPTTPRLQGPNPPAGLHETLAWLKELLPRSLCALRPEATARPEGVVIRTADRKQIAKARFDDYERTLR